MVNKTGLYDAMADALEFWVRECDIDGYRCDVAEKVPTDFWEKARRQMERVNPEIFMLAEAEVPEHHLRAFDMSYGWEMHHIMNQVAKRRMVGGFDHGSRSSTARTIWPQMRTA